MFKQKLSKIFRNPFYCGVIVNKILEGEVVKSKHEALISEKQFLQINGLLQLKRSTYKHNPINEETPLRMFVKCAECKSPLTSYVVKRKRLYYYKCRTMGCRCNRGAKMFNNKFWEFLKSFELSPKLKAPFRKQLEYTFNEITMNAREESTLLKSQLTTLQTRLEKVEEKYFDGDVTKEVFNKHHAKLVQEIDKLNEEIEKVQINISNNGKLFDQVVFTASNLLNTYQLGSFTEKRQLLGLIFPRGVLYDKRNDAFRTEEVNLIFDLIQSFSEKWEQKKSRQSNEILKLSAFVEREGFEPPEPSQVQRFSRPPHSTALPSL
jgi:site-specific DNA recombinase